METLTVPGIMGSLKTIREYAKTAAAAAGLDKKAAYNLHLAVDEIATNIITYGYQEAGLEGMVGLQASIDENTLTISLEDTGLAYDPRQREVPDSDQPIEERGVGGWGVYLAMEGVDKFEYERVGNRNRNILIVNRSAGSSEKHDNDQRLVTDNTETKHQILKTAAMFADFSDKILTEIAALMNEVEFKAGEMIFEKGSMGRSMYVIVSGQVRVHDGKQTFNYLNQGDIFGEIALLSSGPRIASVTAVKDVRLLHLDQKTVYALMAEQKEVVQEFLHSLSHHLRIRVQNLNEVRSHLDHVILPLSIALSNEKDIDRLLERILVEAKSLCNADAGTLYLQTEDDCLKFVVMRTDSLNIAMGGTTGQEIPFPPLCMHDETGNPNDHNVATYVALNGHSINIPDIYAPTTGFDFSATKIFDEENHYCSVSNLTIPLKNHINEVIGVLQLFNAQEPTTGVVIPFTPYQQLIVESLSSQAAVVLNSQRLIQHQTAFAKFEHDLQIGHKIQVDFLPSKDQLPQPDGWEIATYFHPAREVAGDFFDAFPLPRGRIGLVIADVCDKGVGAALFMALSRSLLRAFAGQHHPLSWMDAFTDDQAAGDQSVKRRKKFLSAGTNALLAVELTNNYIAKNHGDMYMFATLFFGILDPTTGLLTYINGGHDAPALVSSTGVIKARLAPTGPAVGMMPDQDFDVEQIRIEPGDLLMTFSDGVPDARSPAGQRFTPDRLMSLLEQAQPISSAAALLKDIETSVHDHIGEADQFDDITMLAVWRAPLPEA